MDFIDTVTAATVVLIVPVLVKLAWQVGRFAARHEPPNRRDVRWTRVRNRTPRSPVGLVPG